MTLKVMYVLEKDSEVYGTAPILPYQFAAEESTDEKTGKNFRCIVNIVMPLGGSESGLFRYPKKGEKVLVGVEENGSYLMGYLPEDTADNINTGTGHKEVMPDEMAGQFFRYKGPNDYKDYTDKKKVKKDKKKVYSEIGFYHEETKWKEKDAKATDPAPKIDTLKITSEGDINQKARNHNQIKAKRFELLVDCDGSKNTDKESINEYAFGDQAGDDTELYAGDAHIRAKNRIIIKAEDEIRLEVGRSSIIITDIGVSIVSRKSRTNVATSWDTTLTLNAADGVSMFGQKVKVDAGIDFLLTERFGGSISSMFGVVRINGLDIRLATMNTLNYITKGIMHIGASAVDLSAMIMGMFKQNDKYSIIKMVSTYGSLAGRLGSDALTPSTLGKFDIKDFPGIMLTVFDITRSVLMVVNVILEMTIPNKLLREVSETRNGIYMGMWVVQYGLMITTFAALSAAGMAGAIHESVIWLNSKSQIKMDSGELSLLSAFLVRGNSVVAGMTTGGAGYKEVIQNGWKKLVDKVGEWGKGTKVLAGLGAVGAGLGTLGAGAGIGVTYFGVTNPLDDEFYKELRSL